jgi:hypothetical protein
LRPPAKIISNKAAISRAASCWIAAAFFFLCRYFGFLDGPTLTDLHIDLYKRAAQLLVFSELVDFALGLADVGRRGQGFADRFAIQLIGHAQGGPVTGIIGLGAVASGLPAAAHDSSDGAGTQIL